MILAHVFHTDQIGGLENIPVEDIIAAGESIMTEFKIGQTVYSHAENIFDIFDERFTIAVPDVQDLAADLENFYSEFVEITEQRIVAIIQVRAALDGVEIQGKVPPGMEWFVAVGDILKLVATNHSLLNPREYPNSKAVIGRGWVTCYGAKETEGAAYKRVDGKLVRITDPLDLVLAKDRFKDPNTGEIRQVLQDLERGGATG